MNCPLCRSDAQYSVATVKERPFFCCSGCDLVFVPPEYHLSVEKERARYALHDNSFSNEGYVRFLSQVADIVEKVSVPKMKLLDFGCGEHAVLTAILRSRGMTCDAYDPLYDFPPLSAAAKYDGVIMCEVIEHCRDLTETLGIVYRLCDSRGIVVVRTQCRPDNGELSRWWYAQDPTHVNLFSRGSLEEVAIRLKRSLLTTEYPDVFLIR